jgi:beta-mannosidase
MPPDFPDPHDLGGGWRMAFTAPGACATPADAAGLTDWIDAVVPGTAAEALELAGGWRRDAPEPLHDRDVWYRLDVTPRGRGVLRFEGLATISEVWLGETPVLTSRSMFEAQEAEASLDGGALWICFRALGPELAARGPRARWRPRMIEPQGLRLVRTTLLGHMPGWCPPIDIVGPWRPVRFIPAGAIRPTDLRVQADWGDGARLEVELTLPGLSSPPVLTCAGASAPMTAIGPDRYGGRLSPAVAETWWPHTHGPQPLYTMTLRSEDREVELGRTGFRRIEIDRGADGRGFGVRVNGEPVFCRGACWITPDLVHPAGARADYEPTLRLAREAGFNMIRVTGVGLYESRAFFDLCDELGLLVWQDFMFANFDYPASEPAFAAAVEREARSVLGGTQGSPSLAVLCGGSEVTQQAVMMGLPPLGWPLFDEVLAQEAARLRPDAPYLPNTPWGGLLPFTASEGVTHYYGVGAYERPLEDARRAEVRFASECLALANVPQPETLAAHLPAPPSHDPRWKARVPRDRGASWDFEDVRDHYLARLFERDPHRQRREDPALYLDLSRMVSGELMTAVFSEWRRGRSPCAGGLVWTLRDLEIGGGWGLIDATGEPKPAWYALKRLLQPVAVALTDEGVNGIAIHLFNDLSTEVKGELRLRAFDDGAPVLEASRPITVGPRSAMEVAAFDLIGRFYDISYAYRFGPRPHAVVLAELLVEGAVVAEAIQFQDPQAGLAPHAVEARLEGEPGAWRLVLSSARLLRYVHIADPRYRPSDDGFTLAPGASRIVGLEPRDGGQVAPRGEIRTVGGHVVGAYGQA